MGKRSAKHNQGSSDVTACKRRNAKKENLDFVNKCRENARKRIDVRRSGEICI